MVTFSRDALLHPVRHLQSLLWLPQAHKSAIPAGLDPLDGRRHLTKDEKYLRWCADGARLFSTCGKRQYLAIVVGADGRVLGTGYNGGPAGLKHCNEGGCPRLLADSTPNSDYSNCIALHAEQNALLHSDRSARTGGTLYVNGVPCPECGKQIVGSGIARVVGLEERGYRDTSKVAALLQSCNVQLDILPPVQEPHPYIRVKVEPTID